MKKPRKLVIGGIILILGAIILSIIIPPILEEQVDSRVQGFDVGSTILKDTRGTPPVSPGGEVPILMGNLTFLSILWDKILGGDQFPWSTYRYLPSVEMVDSLSRAVAVDSQGLYLPETSTNIDLISDEIIQDLFDSKKLYCDQGFDINHLEKKNYLVEDLLTSKKVNISFLRETQINDIDTYVYRGFRNTTNMNIRDVFALLKIPSEIFIDGSENLTNGGFTEPLQKRFSSLINTTCVSEKQVIHYFMAKKLGVPLNIMVDYDVIFDFPLISELMLNEGFIKPVLEGNITINPLFRPIVNNPGKIQQVVFFNITIPPDGSHVAIVHQDTYFANGTTGEKLPAEFQLHRSPVFAVNRETLAYTSYPGAMNRTGLFFPLCKETTPRSISLWDEVTNTSGIAYYTGTHEINDDTFVHYTLYQEDVIFSDIPLFNNISTLLNLDILYDGTTTYVLNQTTGFLYDIIFQGEFKLYLPFTIFPLEVPLGTLSLSFTPSLKEFMKEVSGVIDEFKPLEGTKLNAGSLHLEYTPSLTQYFSSLRGDALQWMSIIGLWFPITVGLVGGLFILTDSRLKRRKT